MKNTVLFIVLFALLAGFVCVSATDMEQINQTKVLRVGTAPDYIPFVLYDENEKLTGIDIELIREAARRQGITVEVLDLAFDSLLDALTIGQIDIAAGGISITESRSQKVDFTRAYYASTPVIIAKNELNLSSITGFDALRGMSIAVEKGTSFEEWVHKNLIEPQILSESSVFLFSTAADVVNALDRGNTNLAILDQDVFVDSWKDLGKYKTLYEAQEKEHFAFAVRKGSDLVDFLNNSLTDMINDGAAQNIANRFFSMDYSFKQNGITRKSNNNPAPTGCIPAMSFLLDVNIPDGYQLGMNEKFTKTWRVYNNGTCAWDPNTKMVYAGGDLMSGRSIPLGQTVAPGQSAELSVEMVSPAAPGSYKGYWQMQTASGYNFGQTLWTKVNVLVQDDGQNNPSKPGVQYFTLSPESGPSGSCTTASWAVNNTSMVEITVDGNSVYRGSDTQSSTTVCDEIKSPGKHDFQLMAFNVYDTTYAYASFYNNSAGSDDGQNDPVIPGIEYFYISPESDSVTDCTDAYWKVSDTSLVEITVDGVSVYRGEASEGSHTVCNEIQGVGNHYFELSAFNVYDTSYAGATYSNNGVVYGSGPYEEEGYDIPYEEYESE